MPTKEVGHGHGPCHTATTPLDRRYLECSFEDIERTIHVCLYFPTTGAGIKATMLPVLSIDKNLQQTPKSPKGNKGVCLQSDASADKAEA
jgi:hypothetical protein